MTFYVNVITLIRKKPKKNTVNCRIKPIRNYENLFQAENKRCFKKAEC